MLLEGRQLIEIMKSNRYLKYALHGTVKIKRIQSEYRTEYSYFKGRK